MSGSIELLLGTLKSREREREREREEEGLEIQTCPVVS
jgi:hypothetical protein